MSNVRHLDANGQAVREELQKRYYLDRVAFCREVLPHWMPKPMPWFHRGYMAILLRQADFLLNFGEEQWAEGSCRWTKKKLSKIVRHFVYPLDPTNPHSPMLPIFKVRYAEDGRTPIGVDMELGQFTNCILPRGCAKTTVGNASLLSMILYLETKYFVYMSDTEGHAVDQLASIKRELETNEHIVSIWGNIVPDRADAEKWTDTYIETLTGVLGAVKGSGSQVRGMNKFSERPDFILLDDMENDVNVLTDEQRLKTRKWVKKVVEPALPRVKGTGRIVSTGTILHPDCLVVTLERDPKYTTIKLGAVDPDGEALWTEYMTLEDVEKERRSFMAAGQLFEFGLEYMSSIRLEDKVSFKSKDIEKYRFYTEKQAVEEFPFRALCIDPAISEDRRADFCALGAIGLDPHGRYHILEVVLEKGMSPHKQVDKYFELSKRWSINRHGMEAVAYQKALAFSLREEMMRQKHFFELLTDAKLMGGKKNKILRVEGILQKRYAAGLFTHNQRFPEYEAQLLDWPHGKKDGPDVIAMCVALLEPFAGVALEGGEEFMSDEPTLSEIPPAYIEWAP